MSKSATPIILPWNGVWPTIHETAFVAPGAVVIGDVHIGAGSSIWYGTVVRGDVHEIRIGSGTNIQDNSVVHVSKGKHGTYIGDNVTIGHCAILHACTVGDLAFIGMAATVMDFAEVEAGGMVAAGALVTPGKRVESGSLWAGRPARHARPLSDEEKAYLDTSARRYTELAAGHKEMLAGLDT